MRTPEWERYDDGRRVADVAKRCQSLGTMEDPEWFESVKAAYHMAMLWAEYREAEQPTP